MSDTGHTAALLQLNSRIATVQRERDRLRKALEDVHAQLNDLLNATPLDAPDGSASGFPSCRFCHHPIAERSIESTDGQRSHPGCYQQWVQKTLAEIA